VENGELDLDEEVVMGITREAGGGIGDEVNGGRADVVEVGDEREGLKMEGIKIGGLKVDGEEPVGAKVIECTTGEARAETKEGEVVVKTGEDVVLGIVGDAVA